jgi:hypothetical protein
MLDVLPNSIRSLAAMTFVAASMFKDLNHLL